MIWLAVAAGALVGVGVVIVAVALVASPVGSHPAFVWPVATRVDRLPLRLAVGGAAAIAVLALTGWVVGAVWALVAGLALPSLLGARGAREAEVAKVEAIAGWTEMLRDTVAAGNGLIEALEASATVAPRAIRSEVTLLVLRLQRGRLVPALRQLAADLAHPMGDLVVAGLLLAATEQAKRLADMLGTLSGVMRDEAALRLRVEAARARTRTTARSVGAITAVTVAGFLLLRRSYFSPYDSSGGQLVLALIGACFFGAYVLLARMGRPDLPRRFLLPADEARA